MPQAIPFAVAYAASNTAAAVGATVAAQATIAATAATVAATVQTTALLVGASYAVSKLSATKTPRPADGSVERRDSLAPRFYPYGLCKVSGPVLLLALNDRDLLKVTAFSSRELASIVFLYVDGVAQVLDPGTVGDGYYLNWEDNDGDHHGFVNTHLGSDSQTADTDLIAGLSGWTSDHRLRGIAYAYARFQSGDADDFQNAFPNGEPSLAALGGVKVYDPRKDSTNGGSGSHRMNNPASWEFSANQRLCCLDWITWRDGYAKDWARIDWATWLPQINMADDPIQLKAGGTEPRYQLATIVYLNEPKQRVLRRILDAGDQQLFKTSTGLIGSRGGVWQAPTVALDATQLLEGQFTHGVPQMDRCNEFQLSATLPSHDYGEVELESWSNESDPEFLAGIVRRQPLELLQVPSNGQAQRLAKIRMAKANPRWSGSIRTNFKALDALGEAAVDLSFPELDQPAGSFDGPFLINGKIGFLADRTGMTLAVSAIDPACYDWDAATEEQDPPPTTTDVIGAANYMADDADQSMLDDADEQILAEAA